MINVLIADDHAIIRNGVKQLLALSDDIRSVAEAANGQQVIEWLQERAFDIILLDLNMPDTQGVELIEKIHRFDNRLPILVLSMHEETQIAMLAIQAGASGYLTKDSDPLQLLAAIRKVAAGGRFIDEKLAFKASFDELQCAIEVSQDAAEPRLSGREQEVLALLADGHSLTEISEKLDIERGTVGTYKARIMRKMGLRNNVELMRFAVLMER